MRYCNTERLGVNATELITINEIGWIFREQPLVDVGIDAIIEQSIEGQPTGKFLAVQIKTGESNFHFTKEYLTYYISNVHYNYWLQLDFPIILVAHLPESDCTYWKVINKATMLKTKKRWKIKIKKDTFFDKNAINSLSKLLSNKSIESVIKELYKGDFESDFSTELGFPHTNDSLKKIGGLLEEITKISNQSKLDVDKFIYEGVASTNDPKVKATFKKMSRQYSLTSKRLENEVIMFSGLFSEEVFTFERYLRSVFCNTENELVIVEPLRKEAEVIIGHITDNLTSFAEMRKGAEKMPKQISVLKKARSDLIDVIDLLLEEFAVSKEIFVNMLFRK